MSATYTITYSGKTLNGALITGTSHESARNEQEAIKKAESRVTALYPDLEKCTLKTYAAYKEEEEDEPYF